MYRQCYESNRSCVCLGSSLAHWLDTFSIKYPKTSLASICEWLDRKYPPLLRHVSAQVKEAVLSILFFLANDLQSNKSASWDSFSINLYQSESDTRLAAMTCFTASAWQCILPISFFWDAELVNMISIVCTVLALQIKHLECMHYGRAGFKIWFLPALWQRHTSHWDAYRSGLIRQVISHSSKLLLFVETRSQNHYL